MGNQGATSTTNLSFSLSLFHSSTFLAFLFQFFKLDAGVDAGVGVGVGLGEAWD